MAVFTAEMRKLSKELIQTMTEFQPSNENFRPCFRFVKSNFQFHRFLDINHTKVTRSVRGLCEKFTVHSQPEKARALEVLTRRFLGLDLEKSYPKSDAHYGALLLLICLSSSPLHADYLPPLQPPGVPTDEGDAFDWATYLMQGIEYPSYSDSESEWSELSEEEEEEEGVGERTLLAKPNKMEFNDSAVGEDLEEEEEELPAIVRSKQWLAENITTPYWDHSNPEYASIASLPSSRAHPACNMAANWAAYSQRVEPFFTSVDSVEITETQAVRETLWVLLGAENSFVYEFEEKVVSVRRGIHVSHLSPLSLQRQLEHFASVATLLRRLRQFTKSSFASSSLPTPSSSPSPPHTTLQGAGYTSCHVYESFVDALVLYLQGFSVQLQEIEKNIVDKKHFVSLMRLSVELTATFREVEALYSVFTEAVLQPQSPSDEQPCASTCSSRLLSSLWNSLQYYDSIGPAGSCVVRLLFPLWVLAVQPYLAMLDGWMTRGELSDRHKEFCIQRNSGLAAGSASYWESCFEAREPVPCFLQPVMDKVLLAGKSMHLVERMGKLKQVESPRRSSSSSPSSAELYTEFVQSLTTELRGWQISGSSPTSADGREREGEEAARQTAPYHRSPAQMKAWNVDPLLGYYLSYIALLQSHDRSPDNTNPSKALWEEMQTLIASGSLTSPITTLLQEALFPLLHRRYLKACGGLVQLLRSEYNLTKYFKTVQLVFLVEAGDAMHQFYSEIFHRIANKEAWQDPVYLNSVLEEALQDRYPHVEDCVTVELQEVPVSLQESPIHSIFALSLRYEVPWPVDTIFSPPQMQTYQEIFHFLLQVKWAKWSLEQLRNRACSMASLSREDSVQLHLLHLLRAKMLHFVNNLNHYLMTRILHSIGLDFQRSIAQAEDLDEIVSLHKLYVSTIFDRCLLNKKAHIVKEAIMKILNLTLTFRQKWQEGGGKFSFSDAEQIETEFSKCSHFLVSCLNSAVKRGSFPHLETLAFSLQTLKSSGKIFNPKLRTRMEF